MSETERRKLTLRQSELLNDAIRHGQVLITYGSAMDRTARSMTDRGLLTSRQSSTLRYEVQPTSKGRDLAVARGILPDPLTVQTLIDAMPDLPIAGMNPSELATRIAAGLRKNRWALVRLRDRTRLLAKKPISEPEIGKAYRRVWATNPGRPSRTRWVREVSEHAVRTVTGPPGSPAWTGHRENIGIERFRRHFAPVEDTDA